MYSMSLLDFNVVAGTALVSLSSGFSFSRFIRLISSNDKQKLEEFLFPVRSSVFPTFQRVCSPDRVLKSRCFSVFRESIWMSCVTIFSEIDEFYNAWKFITH